MMSSPSCARTRMSTRRPPARPTCRCCRCCNRCASISPRWCSPGFIGATPPAALPRIPKYLEADLIRLTKAKNDKNRDVRWAWEADEARQLVDKAVQRAKTEPAGPRHEALTKQADDARWMLEEFYVSLWAQELGTAKPVSLQRIKKNARQIALCAASPPSPRTASPRIQHIPALQ